VCLGLSPILLIGNIIAQKVVHAQSVKAQDQSKEGNLLAGDAIVNFKTIQSFGHTEMVIKKYIEFMEPVYKSSVSTHIKTGFAFGMSQFGQYAVFAGMFFAAGVLIEMEPEEG